MSLADWDVVDKVDLSAIYSPNGITERLLLPLEEAVDVVATRVVHADLPEGTPVQVEQIVHRLERALAVMQAGVMLQSQRYDERVQEAEEKDAENERLRVDNMQLQQQVRHDTGRPGTPAGPASLQAQGRACAPVPVSRIRSARPQVHARDCISTALLPSQQRRLLLLQAEEGFQRRIADDLARGAEGFNAAELAREVGMTCALGSMSGGGWIECGSNQHLPFR